MCGRGSRLVVAFGPQQIVTNTRLRDPSSCGRARYGGSASCTGRLTIRTGAVAMNDSTMVYSSLPRMWSALGMPRALGCSRTPAHDDPARSDRNMTGIRRTYPRVERTKTCTDRPTSVRSLRSAVDAKGLGPAPDRPSSETDRVTSRLLACCIEAVPVGTRCPCLSFFVRKPRHRGNGRVKPAQSCLSEAFNDARGVRVSMRRRRRSGFSCALRIELRVPMLLLGTMNARA